jgi:protein TonB
MFSNLIESGSHRRDLARKGRFFLGTLAFYGALLATAALASVQAYNARLEAQTYSVTLLPPQTFKTPDTQPEPERRPAAPRPAGTTDQLAQRPVLFTDLNTAVTNLPPVSTRHNPIPPVRGDITTIIGRGVVDPAGVATGPALGNVSGTLAGSSGPRARVPTIETEDVPPPDPLPTATPKPPDRIRVSSQILSGKAINKPAPAYPTIARLSRTQGSVAVEVLIDEDGRVISAAAKDGPAVLRVAAESAARQARFTPTILNGRPVKVSGVITYNFLLQ